MNINKTFGAFLRRRRESCALSQAELARKIGCPQPNISRLELGRRSANLAELLSLAKALNTSVSDLLAELEQALGMPEQAFRPKHEESAFGFSPAFSAALSDEETAISQLAAYGVRFMGGAIRPTVFKLCLEETLLAGLKYVRDPRVFEALPFLLVQHAQALDWNRLVSAAFTLQLQNRLGAVVAAGLQLKDSGPGVSAGTREILRQAHNRLAEARLDREDVVGPRPRTQGALKFLEKRTPPWLRFWHVLGSLDTESLSRSPR